MEQDLIDLLVAEHRRIESLLADVDTARSDAARRAAVERAVAAVAAHADVEEARLRPLLPAVLAEYEAAEHRRLKEPVELAEWIESVREHMQEEETELFPRVTGRFGG